MLAPASIFLRILGTQVAIYKLTRYMQKKLQHHRHYKPLCVLNIEMNNLTVINTFLWQYHGFIVAVPSCQPLTPNG